MAQGDNSFRSRELPLAEVARLLRRSRGYIAAAISEGLPATSTRGPRGTIEWRIDAGKAAHWLEARAVKAARSELETRHAQEVARLEQALEAASGDPSEPISRTEALRRRAVLELRFRELDLAEREGSSIPTSEVTMVCTTIMTVTRDRILGVPVRIAPELAIASEPSACAVILEDALREALTELADMGEQLAARAREARE